MSESISQQLKEMLNFSPSLSPQKLPCDDITDDHWKPKLQSSQGQPSAIIIMLVSSEQGSARGISYMEHSQLRGKDRLKYESKVTVLPSLRNYREDALEEGKAAAK